MRVVVKALYVEVIADAEYSFLEMLPSSEAHEIRAPSLPGSTRVTFVTSPLMSDHLMFSATWASTFEITITMHNSYLPTSFTSIPPFIYLYYMLFVTNNDTKREIHEHYGDNRRFVMSKLPLLII